MYFVFEGVDGVGKTTTIRNVIAELNAHGAVPTVTKEPGGLTALEHEIGTDLDYRGEPYESLRELCVNRPDISNLAKRAIFLADSFVNWETVVAPALERKELVLSDRSWVSDLAYGSVFSRGKLSIEALYLFNTALIDKSKVTKVIFLTCPADIREERLSRNIADANDKFSAADRDAVVDAYYNILVRYFRTNDVCSIDTTGTEQEVAKAIVKFILSQ